MSEGLKIASKLTNSQKFLRDIYIYILIKQLRYGLRVSSVL
jgi:hypothetical protein